MSRSLADFADCADFRESTDFGDCADFSDSADFGDSAEDAVPSLSLAATIFVVVDPESMPMTILCLPFCSGWVSVANLAFDLSHSSCSLSLLNNGSRLLCHSTLDSTFRRTLSSFVEQAGCFERPESAQSDKFALSAKSARDFSAFAFAL